MPTLAAKPDILPDAYLFWVAFWQLLPDRNPDRIPFTAIDRWAERNGIGGDLFDVFCNMIVAMDLAATEFSEQGNRSDE